jgi:PhnB protein
MTKTVLNSYLFFGGRCEEALAFYGQAIGAQIDMVVHYKDSPEPTPPGMLAPGFENKVMHASCRIGDSVLMASDGCGPGANFSGFSMSLTLPTLAEAEKAFNALADGGKITMPMAKTFWSPGFGMLTDRFGLDWMVTVTH